MTISPISDLTRSDATAQTQAQTKNDPANKQMFMQLLVAQIKNQNPLNPADGVQFLTQLAQFSELEQMMAIREGIDSLKTPATPATPATEETR